MSRITLLRTAAVLGALAVAFGAFGAHGLEGRVPDADLTIFETAVRYHAWHALALLACACLPADLRRVGAAAWCLLAGTVVFSGSLYLLVLLDQRWLGAVTPLGGTLLIAGWVVLATARPARDDPGS